MNYYLEKMIELNADGIDFIDLKDFIENSKYPAIIVSYSLKQIQNKEYDLVIGDKILKEDLKLLNNVSYGVSIKAAYEDMSSAISKADGLMYAEKEKKKMCRNYFTY